MAQFRYRARDTRGQLLSGEMDASDAAAVADLLLRRQLTPLQIELLATRRPINLRWLQRRVNLTELIMFSRQMYSLMRAGIPIIRAINGLADSTSSVALRSVLLDLTEQLERGRALSLAMASHEHVFSRLMVSLVHVGENTGRLDEAFAQLAAYYEQELETRRQIRQATRYPFFVLLALVVALVLLNVLVIPQFAAMFKKFNAELPWSTQLLIGMSDFFVHYWYWLVLALASAGFALWQWLQTASGKLGWSKLKLRLPLVGSIINRATLGRYSRSFALMLRSGVPLTTALNLVADAVDNDFMAGRIHEMRRHIERGESLVRVSTQSALFTPLVLQMLAVGEETGQMDEMLQEVALFYEREVAFELRALTAKIEPVLITVVSVMVLILALGIFTPMWDMLGAYRQNK